MKKLGYYFLYFFKFGDVVAGIMANPFYVKIGFSNIEIANASKIFGVIMTLVGVFLGGYLVKKIGLINSLIISAFFQILSNLLYVMLNSIGSDFDYLLLTVAGENFSGGLKSAAFVTYLSVLCKERVFWYSICIAFFFYGSGKNILVCSFRIHSRISWLGNLFSYFNCCRFAWFINSFFG